MRRFGAEAFFDGVDGAEDEFVDDVDYVVEEGLEVVLARFWQESGMGLTSGV